MVDRDKYRLVSQLRERMVRIAPLEDEVDFFVRDDTLLRFLKARDWSVDDAEKQLKDTVEWRRQMNPLSVDCRWCHERPGYHCVRQVGFDKQKRPVIYACFSQAGCSHGTVEDTIVHMTHLIENAKRTMSGDASQWVFIMDCTGMSLPACNPRLGYGVTNAMATYYPERLGLVICINHNPVFQGVWNAFKVFLHPNTQAKMQLLRKKTKYREAFFKLFDEELASWLIEEIKLNKQRPIPVSQRQFWKAPDSAGSSSVPSSPAGGKGSSSSAAASSGDSVHDPRASPAYIRQYIDTFLTEIKKEEDGVTRVHQPHPNIVDELRGTIKQVEPTTPSTPVANGNSHNDVTADDNSDVEDDNVQSPVSMDNISEEFQLPKELLLQQQPSVQSAKK